MSGETRKLSDEYLKGLILSITDYPKPGVVFRDITPLIGDAEGFNYAIERMYEPFKNYDIDLIAGIEARGFIFGSALSAYLKKGFVPIRKENKLPRDKIKAECNNEYGNEILEMHVDAIKAGQKVLIVDDVFATGSSAAAATKLVEQLGGEVVGLTFLIELLGLNGRDKLKEYKVHSVITY